MSKKNSFTEALTKMGMVEEETPPTTHADYTAQSAQGAAWTPPVTSSATPILTADDEARKKALEAQIYAVPSSYLIFQKVRERLGSSATIQSVFDILSVANPDVTPAKVKADIEAHLGVIASKKAEFDHQIEQAKTSRIDGVTAQISGLAAANTQAQQEITDRAAKIATLQASLQDSTKAIQDGTARFQMIEDQLSAPLLQTKQLLSSIS